VTVAGGLGNPKVINIALRAFVSSDSSFILNLV